MKKFPEPIDLSKVRVYPLAERQSLSALGQVLVDPVQPPRACGPAALEMIRDCALKVAAARQREASVILMYGAHVIKNGAMGIVNRLVEGGWVTHFATNGAGAIHDWGRWTANGLYWQRFVRRYGRDRPQLRTNLCQ